MRGGGGGGAWGPGLSLQGSNPQPDYVGRNKSPDGPGSEES